MLTGFKKWKFVLPIIALTIAACGNDKDTAASTSDSSDKTYNLRLATVVSPPHSWVDAANFLAEEVEKQTDGKVKISIHHSGTLGNDERIIDEMQEGAIDFIIGGTQNASPYLKQFQLFSIPYLFESEEHFKKATDPEGELTERYKELLAETKFKISLLGFAGGGIRYTSTRDRVIKNVDDLRGLKLRLPGSPIASKVWSELGAVPTSMPFGEIYSALQTGVVDGFESTISGYTGSKLYEVAPNVSATHHEFMVTEFMISDVTKEKLPAEYLEVINNLVKDTLAVIQEKGDEYDTTLLAELEEKGVNITMDVDVESIRSKIEPLHGQFAKEADAEDILEIIRSLAN